MSITDRMKANDDPCYGKLHKWNKWTVSMHTINNQPFEERRCRRCGKTEYKKITFRI